MSGSSLTIILFKKFLGWRSIFYVSRNVAKTRLLKSSISTQTLRAIEGNNTWDVKLYKYVERIFNEMLQVEDIDRSKVSAFRRMNKCYNAFFGSVHALRQFIKS